MTALVCFRAPAASSICPKAQNEAATTSATSRAAPASGAIILRVAFIGNLPSLRVIECYNAGEPTSSSSTIPAQHNAFLPFRHTNVMSDEAPACVRLQTASTHHLQFLYCHAENHFSESNKSFPRMTLTRIAMMAITRRI